MTNPATIIMDNRQINIYLPVSYDEILSFPVLYFHSDNNTMNMIDKNFDLSRFPFITVAILSDNRLDDYSPWPSNALSSRFPNFGGKADTYLDWIITCLKPHIDKIYKTIPESTDTAVLGRSLAGLLNMYAICKYDVFGVVAAISPSVWYKNFVDYFKHNIITSEFKISIIGGEDEAKDTDNIRVNMGQNIKQCFDIMNVHKNIYATLNLDDGGHHQFVTDRYSKAFLWISDCFKNGNKVNLI